MCLLPKISSMYHRLLSVCFPNVFSMVSEWFPYTPNGFRIDRILPEYGPFAPRTPTFIFGKHSSCSKFIRGVRKAYGSQHLNPNAPRTRRMLSERFRYTPYVPRMLPENFPNTPAGHIRKVDENYFENAQHIFGATECSSIYIRTEPNSQYVPRIHRMLPEYGPFAPRTPKFLFGKYS
jgi:hypothetical protein